MMDQGCRGEEMSSLFCFLLGRLPSLKPPEQEVKKPSRRGLKSSVESLTVLGKQKLASGSRQSRQGPHQHREVPLRTPAGCVPGTEVRE